MSGFTKDIIARTLIELLDEKPMSKVTVKDIVERCGVNRNTFYYHFHDIPEVVEYVLKRKWDEILNSPRESNSILECMEEMADIVKANRRMMLNVYRSVGREQVEQYLYKLLDPTLKEYADRECKDITVQDADKQFVVDFYKYALVGMTLEWIRRDMKTDPAAMTERLGTMIHGDLRRALCRLASNRGGTARDED